MADDDRQSLLAMLAEAYDEAIANGDTRGLTTDDSVPPDLLPELRDMQACLQALHDACRDGLIGGAPDLPSSDSARQPRPATMTPLPRAIGRFEIVRELGRGGYGIVFEAIDPHLNRTVALKVPRPDALASDELRDRFLREAEAAGALEHPNLVPVYEVGQDGPICYIASAYCQGPTLASWLMHNQQATVRQAAQWVAAVAGGIAKAHRHGVLHRDIKPSNVLLDTVNDAGRKENDSTATPLEEFTPRLTDFGLAKLLERNDDRTRTGTLLGTPAYMAPEQAEGRTGAIGPATDIYALGVLLYELLTGRPPFRGENDADTLRQVSVGEPLPPSRLRPRLPRDLEAICLKCLEHNPQKRYSSAAELVDDLRRWLEGRPTLARPLNAAQRATRWAMRRPLVAGLIAFSTALFLMLLAGISVYSARVAQHAAAAEEQRQQAVASEMKTRHLLYAADLRAAQIAWNEGRPKNAEEILSAYLPHADQPDLREFAWQYLWSLTSQNQVTLRGHAGDVYDATFSPDQRLVATCGKDHTVRLWDTEKGRQSAVFDDHASEVNHVTFSPDGRWLVSVGDDGQVRVHDVATRDLVQTLSSGDQAVFAVAFSPDGSRLATGGKDNTIHLWDTAVWKICGQLQGHTDFVQCLTYSPDGKQLASGGESVRLWDLAAARQLRSFDGFTSTISSLAFTARGDRLVAGSRDHTARLWQLDKEVPAVTFIGHTGAIHDLALSHGDQWLATASKDGTVILWDTSSGQQRRIYRGHAARVWSVTFAPGGQTLLTASGDGTAKLCKISDTHRILRDTSNGLPGDFHWREVTFSPDGKYLAGGGVSNSLDVCILDDASTWRDLTSFPVPGCTRVAFARSGQVLVGMTTESELILLDLKTGARNQRQLRHHRYAQISAEPHGNQIVVGGSSPLPIWDCQRQQYVGELALGAGVETYAMEFDGTGKLLATVSSDDAIRLWNFPERREIARFETPITSMTSLAFTAGGDLLSCSESGMLRRWTVGRERETAAFDTGMSSVMTISMHPNQRTLAVAGMDGLRLFDLDTRSSLLTLSNAATYSTAFSPDGACLVSGGWGGRMLLWEATQPASSNQPEVGRDADQIVWSAPKRPLDAVKGNTELLPMNLSPDLFDLQARFRAVSNWAERRKAATGFPTYVDVETDNGLAIGAILIQRKLEKREQAYCDEVTAIPIPDRDAGPQSRLPRQVSDWGRTRGLPAMFTDFHTGQHEGRMIFGTHALLAADVETRTVPVAELGDVSTYVARLRAIQPYARQHGFVGGFPDFQDSQVDGKPTIGVVLIKHSGAVAITIPAEELR